MVMSMSSHAIELLPQAAEGVDVEKKFGQQLTLNRTFTDHNGKTVTIGDFFDGRRPVLFTLNWYRCTTLCSTQLNELLASLKRFEWTAGKDYRIVTVSIDPREDHKLAAAKRDSYLKALGRGNEVDWTFLTGTKEQIAGLASELGYSFNYDKRTDQYVHTTVLYILTADGKISHYLFGLSYEPRDIRLSLMDASKGRIGNTFDKVLFSCFRYDASSGTYTAAAMDIMRFFAILTVLIFGCALLVFWLVDRRESVQFAEATL
jgi:protein SCO1/2